MSYFGLKTEKKQLVLRNCQESLLQCIFGVLLFVRCSVHYGKWELPVLRNTRESSGAAHERQMRQALKDTNLRQVDARH